MQAINAFRLQPIHRTPSAYSATATEGKEKAEEERNKYEASTKQPHTLRLPRNNTTTPNRAAHKYNAYIVYCFYPFSLCLLHQLLYSLISLSKPVTLLHKSFFYMSMQHTYTLLQCKFAFFFSFFHLS